MSANYPIKYQLLPCDDARTTSSEHFVLNHDYYSMQVRYDAVLYTNQTSVKDYAFPFGPL